MTGPGRTMWLSPQGSPSHLRALPGVLLPSACSRTRPASWLNLEKPETEVRAGRRRVALATYSPLLFL